VLSIPYKKNTKPLLTVQEKNNIIIVFLILPNKKYINTQKTKITQNGLKTKTNNNNNNNNNNNKNISSYPPITIKLHIETNKNNPTNKIIETITTKLYIYHNTLPPLLSGDTETNLGPKINAPQNHVQIHLDKYTAYFYTHTRKTPRKTLPLKIQKSKIFKQKEKIANFFITNLIQQPT
jgi:hypothetical protein